MCSPWGPLFMVLRVLFKVLVILFLLFVLFLRVCFLIVWIKEFPFVCSRVFYPQSFKTLSLPPFTDVQAWWTLWREIGHEMGIHSIPHTYPQIKHWSTQYEQTHLIPSPPTHPLAETTTALLIYYQPSFLKPLAKKVIIGLMDDPLRKAMVYEPQGQWVHWGIWMGFAVRRGWVRNFCLPRWRGVFFTERERNEFGRWNVCYADNEVLLRSSVSWNLLVLWFLTPS